MKIAIFGQFFHKNADKAINILFSYLSKKACHVFIEETFFNTINQHTNKLDIKSLNTFKTLDSSYDLLISIGGDGTILRAITHVKNLGIPIVSLGFLFGFPRDPFWITIVSFLDFLGIPILLPESMFMSIFGLFYVWRR